MHVFRIDVLSPTAYEERLVRTMERPSDPQSFLLNRLHHVDAHRVVPWPSPSPSSLSPSFPPLRLISSSGLDPCCSRKPC